MSHDVKFDKRNAQLELQKNVLVNNMFLYKIELDKEVYRENSNTSLTYTLDVKCPENGINIQVVLPHEVLAELNAMIEGSLIF